MQLRRTTNYPCPVSPPMHRCSRILQSRFVMFQRSLQLLASGEERRHRRLSSSRLVSPFRGFRVRCQPRRGTFSRKRLQRWNVPPIIQGHSHIPSKLRPPSTCYRRHGPCSSLKALLIPKEYYSANIRFQVSHSTPAERCNGYA